MKHRILAFILTCVLVFGLATSVAAQSNYSFQLTDEVVHVYLNQDGTMALDYTFTFANDAGAHVIDFVDVGLPNSYFNSNTIRADVGGTPVDVSTSDYQGSGSGVAVVLGNKFIRNTGTVHIYVAGIQQMFYPDTADETYASSEFAPTFFDSQFVHGKTNLTVVFHLPPGVKPEEPKYHPARGGWPGAADPQTALDNEGRVTYTWTSPDANGYSQYTFGASFPASYIPADAIVRTTFIDLLIGGIAAFFGLIGNILPFCCFGGFFFGIPILGAVQERRRKKQYLPPKISIEGHGIKRGLTAVEAAVLMGQPLEKVMQMILFSVVKKGAAQVETKDPLELTLANPLPTDLRGYETEFLTAFREKATAKRRNLLQTMTVNLVKSVTEKLKGFSSKETIEYYKNINEKAWQQIAAAGTPEVKSQMFEEAFEWTMLDKDYDDRARRTFTGPIFMPMWWGGYDPIYRRSHPSTFGSAPAATSGSAGGGFSGLGGNRGALPGAEFAASVVTGTQNFAQKVLGGNFAEGVTKVTNPPPPPSRSSGGHSGGGGCACACACAGCACACAGGGR